MSETIDSIAAKAEQVRSIGEERKVPRLRTISQATRDRTPLGMAGIEDPTAALLSESLRQEERERRIYRGRTINLLRRCMRYSLDTGRLPSVLGREFFRARVSARSVVTFEDRVIFVHDMETSLNKLDEFSREIIARHILQEHDYDATAVVALRKADRATIYSDRAGLTRRGLA